MKFSQEQLAIINQLIHREARRIAEQVYSEKAAQFGVPKTSFHVHNGVDSPPITIFPVNVTMLGTLTTKGALTAGNGVSGSITSGGHTMTATKGIITSIT